MRCIASLLLGLLLVLGVDVGSVRALGDGPQAPPSDGVEAGAPAPDFTLRSLDGGKVTLSQFRGKVVFLNFWASWCPPCRAEMPSMERLQEAFGGQEFVMLAVNVEQDAASVRRYLKENPHSFEVLLDPEGKAQQLYQVFRFPETFLIDKEGVVIERVVGARNWSSVEFMKQLDQLTKG